jgi:hypothetical protein
LEKQQQHPEVREVIEKTRHRYIEGVYAAVEAGWMSSDALHSVGKVKDAHVVIGDLWDTFMAGNAAYFTFGTGYVVIGQGERMVSGGNDTLENIRTALPHEFSHLQFDDMRDVPEWFMEGMAEHINRSLANGHPDVIDPDDRGDEGTYRVYRRFMANIFDGPNVAQPTKELVIAATRAYTSAPGSVDWRRFIKKFNTAWGKNAFRSFDDTIMARAKKAEGTEKDAYKALEEAVDVEDQRLLRARRHVKEKGRHEPRHAAPRWRYSAKQQRAQNSYIRSHRMR